MTETQEKTEERHGLTDDLPLDELKDAGQEVVRALMVKGLHGATHMVRDLTEKLGDGSGDGNGDGGGTGAKMAARGAQKLAEGRSPLRAGLSAGMTGAKETVKNVFGGGGDGGGASGGDEAKAVTIVEEFDVGLPLRTAYDQWTRFADYPSFTSKVENVEQESDEKIKWRARIFMSHRNWESTITEQVPDDRIVWKSEGDKGYVDGAVTFHRIAPTLTRVLLVAEYHPDGFFEKTANLWRAQGRRLRLDFKHIKRHMMTRAILEQDDIEGWRGEIRDGEVVKTHEDALKEESQAHDGGDSENGTAAHEGDDADAGQAEEKSESS
ncbi:SRPBCC family protein [Actinomadura opuntiae]|uniref:SRPBCC family protein n=1 Tax=Actinomadura sp. OS1-43 TaxID=604315 RepID=UPI00255AC117|nr:SRPBCC family protein [Actinomadura sp. OS1-43]MDL4821434.1 SRPBCC family protein [Actinomadura sp. OS1-43]